MKLLHQKNVLLFKFNLLLACTLSNEESTYRKSTVLFLYFLVNTCEDLDAGFNSNKNKNKIVTNMKNLSIKSLLRESNSFISLLIIRKRHHCDLHITK